MRLDNINTTTSKLGDKLVSSIPLNKYDEPKVDNAIWNIKHGNLKPIKAIKIDNRYFITDGRARNEASKRLNIDYPVEIDYIIPL